MKTKLTIVIMGCAWVFTQFFVACETRVKNPSSEKATNEKQGNKDDSIQQVLSGEHLVLTRTRCLDCHSQRDWSQFGGPIIKGTEGMGGLLFNEQFGAVPGTIYARNITPSELGNWTNEEIIRAITQGITKKGDTLFPVMPYQYYNKLTIDELNDVVAYLRTLKPVENKIPERQLRVSMRSVYPSGMNSDIKTNTKPSDLNNVSYGAYLVNTAGCAHCHTPVNEKRQYKLDKLFAGGIKFKHEKFTAVSANITPDTATGIGNWTEELFLQKFKDYRDPEYYHFNPGRKNTFMPWLSFSQLSDYDLKSIYAYLRTIKPVRNKVEKFPEP